MKAERTMPRTHFEAHAPSDGDLADSRKGPRSSSVEGSLPSSLANRYFDCQKTKGAGFKPPREAARSLQFSRFCFEIWERESAPADYCLIRRLSMDCACLRPSPPPKILTDDKLRPDKHTPGIPVHGCRLAVCSWYVQLVVIESFSSRCAIHLIAQPSLYKTGPPILSSTFCKNVRYVYARLSCQADCRRPKKQILFGCTFELPKNSGSETDQA